MARKMKKFSAGGAQGRYDRRMADIEKDYAKAMTRKTGKAAEVAEAKRQQRIADAKDDLAKRTGADRSATRAAERLAESNLTKTRKYGAAQSVTKDTAGPTGKITDTLGALTAPKSGLATATKTPTKTPAKTPAKVEDKAPAKVKRTYYVSPENRAAIDAAAKKEPISKFDRQAFSDLKTGKNSYGAANIGKTGDTKTGTKTETTKGTGTGTSRLARAADPKDTSAAASRARAGAALSYLNPFSYIPKGASFEERAEAARRQAKETQGKAKGGKVKKEKTMKYAKGGSTPNTNSKPKKPMPKEPITGGADTVPLTPERKEFLKELAKRNAKPGMAKGGKAKAFAATKFGKAMVKKSADTKGRAMVKKAGGGKCYASGGSVSSASKRADGIAVRGKTKTSMTKMKKGGSC